MIFIGIDPGRGGGLAMVSDTEEIMSVNRFQGGLPNLPTGFRLDNSDVHYEVWLEYADWKNAEVGKWKGRKKKDGSVGSPTIITADKIYKAGFHVGLIHHEMYLRGANVVNLVKPRDWQKIYTGIGGKDTKEKALNYLKARLKDPNGDYLKVMGIIGPKGGYKDGIGDAVLIALWARDNWRVSGKQ